MNVTGPSPITQSGLFGCDVHPSAQVSAARSSHVGAFTLPMYERTAKRGIPSMTWTKFVDRQAITEVSEAFWEQTYQRCGSERAT